MRISFDNRLVITILLCLFGTVLFGQDKIIYEPSYDVLVKGEDLFKDGEYKLALEEFNKVYPGDSLFFRYAIHMKMAALNNLEEYEEVRAIGDKYWYFRHELPTEFYLNYGTALDKLEEYDKAQEMYKSILKEYPMNYSLWYNLGISQELEGDFKEAYSTFKKTIEINPFYDRVHLEMARLAFAEQQSSKGIMAIGMYLLNSADRRNNFSELSKGDYMASTKYWADEDFSGSNGLDLGGNEDYEAIDQLVHNYVALREKYKIPSKLSYPLIKQLHLIASQLKEQGGNEDDYWYQTYGKFYVEMLKKKQFEGFTYVISANAENDKMKHIIEKNNKTLLESHNWSTKYLTENSKEADLSFIGFGKTKVNRDSKDHYIDLMGDFELINNGQSIVGDIKFYGSSGRMSAEGFYNKEGKKDGNWKYYHPNGRLKEQQLMKDGEGQDTSYIYQMNGLLNYKIPFKDGKIKGDVLIYENGILSRTAPYDNNGVGSGELVEYHSIGTVEQRYSVTKGKANGSFESHYDSGEIHRKGNYKEGDLDGERITYFKSGEVSYKENFVSNRSDGEYISYFRDGQVQGQGKYKEGNKIGTWEYFYRNGHKNKVQNFDERGKENGQETKYTKEGWKSSEHSYNKGAIDAYKFFDEDGEILSQGERKKGLLEYNSYYQNGMKSAEGQFNKSGRDGEWKFYRYNGSLNKIEHYKDGKQVGAYDEYFPNGESEVSYVYNDKGESEGYYTNYYRSNSLYSQGYLKEGSNDGPWINYQENGNLRSTRFYSGNKLQGFSTSYDVMGNPNESMYYKDGLGMFEIYYDTAGIAFDTIFQTPGKRLDSLRRCADCPVFMTVDTYNNRYHGNQVFLFPNGTIQSEGKVFNGGKEGPWKTYYLNGKVLSEGEYVNNKKHGEWKAYNEDGVLVLLSNYEYGDLNGIYETYDDDGDIDFKANYSYGDLNGDVYYYVGKKEDHHRNYSYGYIETYTFIDKDGKEVTKEMKNETASITTYWKNGKKAREFSVDKGWFEGPYKKYYDNGQLAQDQSYKKDFRDGAYKTYYKSGKLKSEGQYDLGDLTGVYTSYYKSGKKHTEKNYVLGKLHGKSIYYNEDGSIDKTIIFINGNIIAIENK